MIYFQPLIYSDAKVVNQVSGVYTSHVALLPHYHPYESMITIIVNIILYTYSARLMIPVLGMASRTKFYYH